MDIFLLLTLQSVNRNRFPLKITRFYKNLNSLEAPQNRILKHSEGIMVLSQVRMGFFGATFLCTVVSYLKFQAWQANADQTLKLWQL